MKNSLKDFTAFDPVDFLKTSEDIQYYLEAAAQDEDPKAFLRALRTVAKTRGMMELAEKADMPRESLYRALSENGNPNYMTLCKIAAALGMRVTFMSAKIKKECLSKR
ncbi:MAG: putative addiction module antidote protein [Deltaproteobacteria bacterium]|nr:putative addiction module antidote protein [Deltaproteobacteria bacterium]